MLDRVGVMSHGAARAPVDFLVFNRPDLTQRTFDAIAAARPERLLVVADGPRAEVAEDPRLVSETRAILEEVDWPCEVETNYAPVNLGCKERVASGLDWVFSRTDRALILEDDTVPHPSFFPYCEQLLARYEDATEIHHISGSTILEPHRATNDSYYASNCYRIWGWATWARAWSHYDIRMRRWPEVRETAWLAKRVPGEAEEAVLRTIFDRTYADEVPTWDFQWVFSSWLAGGVSLATAVNLVSNIGYGATASHEKDPDSPNANRPAYPMDAPVRHPDSLGVLSEADRATWGTALSGSRDHRRSARWQALQRARDILVGR
jgi:hypothetical protein